MAEAVLRDRLESIGLGGTVEVASAGTGLWFVGRPPDRRAITALSERGYDIGHSARLIGRAELETADLVLAMDRDNLADLRDLVGDTSGVTRIRLMRSFDPRLTHLPEDDSLLDVPDPYYGDAGDFHVALDMIEAAAAGVVDQARLDLAAH